MKMKKRNRVLCILLSILLSIQMCSCLVLADTAPDTAPENAPDSVSDAPMSEDKELVGELTDKAKSALDIFGEDANELKELADYLCNRDY